MSNFFQYLREKRYKSIGFVENAFKDMGAGLNSIMIERIKQKLQGRDYFRFAVLGDSGRNDRVLRYVLAKAIDSGADFLVFNGDLIRSPRISHYRQWIEQVKNLPVPIIFVPGNHDLKGIAAKFFFHIFGPANYYFDVGRFRFIITNANEEVHFAANQPFVPLPQNGVRWKVRKGITMEQIDFLSSLLESGKSSFIFLHLPPKGIWAHHCFKLNAEKFVQLLREKSAQVVRVFCGHIHGYSRKVVQGVTYILTAGAGGRFHNHDPEVIQRYNFVLVEVLKEGVKDTVHFCDFV